MIALQGEFAYSFFLGVVAAVNPCGFVMLPAYLMYFLGLEGSRPGSQRASVQRALVVSAATSAGFITVFVIVATISRLFTSVIVENAKYIALFIGIGMIVLGCFLLAGWKPPFAVPAIGSGKQRTRTFASMFGFGVAYAIASLGCTIPLLISAIFGSFATKGFLSGIISVTLYGAGMALLVTALTVSLAFASGGLLRILRDGMKYVDRIAAVVIMATGFYLTWYWYTAITERTGEDGLTDRVEGWQGDVQGFLERQGVWKLGVVLGALVLAGVVYVAVGRRREVHASDAGADFVMLTELLAHPGVREECELRSTFGFMAFHGGSLEEMTDVIATEAAERCDASYYGLLQPDDLQWHIPSHKLDPAESPLMAAFIQHVDVVVTVHGYGRAKFFTSLLLGGQNRVLAEHVGQRLRLALPAYDIRTDLDTIPSDLRGQHVDNPVNLPRNRGVQIELPPRVRGSSPVWWDWEGPGLTPHTEALIDALASAASTWPGTSV